MPTPLCLHPNYIIYFNYIKPATTQAIGIDTYGYYLAVVGGAALFIFTELNNNQGLINNFNIYI